MAVFDYSFLYTHENSVESMLDSQTVAGVPIRRVFF